MTSMGRCGSQRGVTLIELMIALLIGSLLILGAIQVFGASRSAYQLSEGMARVQENGRFAIDFLQRDIRMAGHFGCVNDQSHVRNVPNGLKTTFAAAPHPALDFNVSIQGYEATGTAPGADLTIASPMPTGGTFSPALPAQIAAATTNRVAGSDIIALRYLAPEGVPVTSIGGTAVAPVLRFDPARWDVLRSGADNPGLFGAADCLGVTAFQANAVNAATGEVTAGTAPNNVGAGFQQVFTAGQTTLFRAESLVYYVGLNPAGIPALYRLRFDATPNGALAAIPQELVEGIENMQLLYGMDRELDATKPPTGYIDNQDVASSSSLASQPERWRRVGSVQVALLASSPERAVAEQAATSDAKPVGLGVSYTTPDDARYRTVYQSTIALRNRLYGN